MDNDEKQIVLLIDADNTSCAKMEFIFEKISTFGRIVVKRAYGNWTKDNLKLWESTLREFAIKPIHQIDYVKGKNATDIALVIDALDFLYTQDYEIFAIVSSDSDFTPLAMKLSESGKHIIGVGRKSSSSAFKKSCDQFVCLESEEEETVAKGDRTGLKKSRKNNNLNQLDKWMALVSESNSDDDGWTNVSAAGQYIKRVCPDFEIKSYGASKLSKYFEMNEDKYETRRNTIKSTVDYRCKY